MQWFSWRTCTVRAAGAAPPGKFVKLDSLKCNSPRSLDQNWVTGKVFKGVKNVHKKRNIWLNYQFAVVRFLVDSKTDCNRKECTNPVSLESESCSLEIVFISDPNSESLSLSECASSQSTSSPRAATATATYNYLSFFDCMHYITEQNKGQVFLWLINGKMIFTLKKLLFREWTTERYMSNKRTLQSKISWNRSFF